MGISPLVVRDVVPCRTDDHDPLDVGQVGLKGRQLLSELLVDYQDLRLRVVDDVSHLRWS